MNQPAATLSYQNPRATKILRIAIVSSSWHKAIVDNSVQAIKSHFAQEEISDTEVDTFEVPGAFELPFHAKILAQSGKYRAIIACGLITNGGIYRHDFVSSAVIDGLMQVQLTSDIPVFSSALTHHNFHEHEDHVDFFAQHFIGKGKEVARACLETVASLEKVADSCV
ncbi:6,7-dimethyl-8-ribityllumazine synthase [Marinobacter sp. M1N3S26]|uniref:6,7-dimethyl-8-ribityllumazine synthase n=1 Tax=Marinobacter sp. M1N3S26 TaxID=3382299 RepID=UPI00387B6C82